ncbi:terminase family protein [Providencia huaxiensis]|uniref:terminase large subunit domain-containing protein n=1 Tax=Providencia huaxiensis TaxID=2027290 RepID=UPI001B394BB6|nr:terminase family protein [Providencia huaxiensis]MBQ0534823.1 terminase family protein [Providencia huaxiensis]MBQ0587553.1 terminase family protein [Providencia huaxiensis]
MKFAINVTSELLIRLAYKMHTDVNDWQERWSNNQFHRNRVLNKARQIGSSWYFSLEALNDACLTGRNKIFIGDALLIQNEIQYLCHHANQMKHEDFMDYFKENDRLMIQLNNGAKIYFISTKCPAVANIVGDVYVPEWSWNSRPSNVLFLAKGIANHNKWRRTFYSTRSRLDPASQQGIVNCINEKAFIDRVNLFESTIDKVWIIKKMKEEAEKYHPDAFGEMFLCKFNGG